ncbi:MAG: signal peptidase I, partial [bacterium]
MFKSLAAKVGKFIGVAITFLVVLVSSLVAYTSVQEISIYLGTKKLIVPVVGTGSMYPSLYWDKTEQGPDDLDKTAIEEYRSTPFMYRRFSGLTIFGRTYLYRPVEFGDMVAFKSDTTREILASEGKDQESGFIKRVIGLPGDTLELRDGYVLRNGERIEEPYLYRPRSTYGQEGIADCQKQIVPPDHYLVLGDNRKISSDSRGKLGFIADSDINYLLPFGEQEIYHSLWRDT